MIRKVRKDSRSGFLVIAATELLFEPAVQRDEKIAAAHLLILSLEIPVRRFRQVIGITVVNYSVVLPVLRPCLKPGGKSPDEKQSDQADVAAIAGVSVIY